MPPIPFQLEICCFNLASAIIAQEAGAQRVELCASPHEGGTTPSMGMIKTCRTHLNIQLYPIIRPRGGDFFYSDEEFEMMLNDVVLCKQLNCDGIATGILDQDGAVDTKRTARLVEWAYPMGVSFHRAFDWSRDPFEALEDIIETGCERILTSGQRPVAMEGATLIKELVGKAGSRIIIMPGSGVRVQNILELADQTGAVEFHTSARKAFPSHMQYLNPAMGSDFQTIVADRREVETISELLKKYFTNLVNNESLP